jgi:hypothetical protein
LRSDAGDLSQYWLDEGASGTFVSLADLEYQKKKILQQEKGINLKRFDYKKG